MTTRRTVSLRLLAPLALLALSACATPFKADVARFQAMPAPTGQTFYVQPAHEDMAGGLEFSTYAALVAKRLEGAGYRPATDAKDANLVVSFDYGVDKGQEKTVSYPRSYGGFGRGWGHYPYWGRGGYRSPFYYGWDDPFWYDPWGSRDVESYTVFTSFIDMKISRTADGERVFEGKAKARSTDDKLTVLVPNLVDALFTGFPGKSGEEIRITVPPPAKQK